MTEQDTSDLQLMQLAVEAGYVHDGDSRLLHVNDDDKGAAPRFFIGRTVGGCVVRFHSGLDAELVARLEALCATESTTAPLFAEPTHRARYCELLAPAPKIWSGPCYRFPAELPSSARSMAVDASNVELLRDELDDWSDCVQTWQPFHVTTIEGKAVSVCASVRISDGAHEAGVETASSHRGHGYAGIAVTAWANAVRTLGAIPLYSTSWDNKASQAVARTLGLRQFGTVFHLK